MEHPIRFTVIGSRTLLSKVEICLPLSAPSELSRYASADEFLRRPDENIPHVLILDESHIESFADFREHAEVFTVVTSARGTIEKSKAAMRRGARDYLRLNRDLPRLTILLGEAVREMEGKERKEEHRHVTESMYSLDSIIGESRSIRKLKRDIERLAGAGARTVLVLGETGTGKELFARVLHSLGKRRWGAFVDIDCAAIPQALLETELFGHEEGAFTDARKRKRGLFELADGGTIFLDEINHLPQLLQVKLLRVLERRQFRRVGGTEQIPVDVTVIAAANEDLADAAQRNAFRKDLYFRLNVVSLWIPPLAERGTDCLLIAEAFLHTVAREYERPVPRLAESARKRLREYPWPGNVRELRNVLERALLFTDGDSIHGRDLDFEQSGLPERPSGSRSDIVIRIPAGGMEKGDLLRKVIEELRIDRGMKVTEIADLLGVSRQTVSKYLKPQTLDSSVKKRSSKR